MLLAFFGGIYSNHLALAAAIADARGRGAERLYCLGDLGAFGPSPDKVFPLLREHGVECVQGNYDDSIGNELADCQCGYTDPRDNHFAQISYDHTLANTSHENRAFLRALPREMRFEISGVRFLLCHGSPRRTNEFLWESATSTAFLDKLADDHEADVILGTHTGIHWQRELSGGRRFVNVGVLGRPENDGATNVWYALVRLVSGAEQGGASSTLEADASASTSSLSTLNTRTSTVSIEFVPVAYDHERLADEMRREGLPDEFVETVLTGWWTTCLEVLPQRERRAGRF